MWRRTAVILLVLGLLLAACREETTTGEPAPDAAPPAPTLEPSPPFPVAEVTLAGPGGQRVDLPVYVARTRPARQLGLMHREDLPAGTGMVFVFAEDSSSGFWMKDTLMPLSIAFVGADGQIVRILDMEPCEADPCPVYSPDATYRVALEVNQGFLDTVGATEGWRVELPEDLRRHADMD
jgi:uncharacterized protein